MIRISSQSTALSFSSQPFAVLIALPMKFVIFVDVQFLAVTALATERDGAASGLLMLLAQCWNKRCCDGTTHDLLQVFMNVWKRNGVCWVRLSSLWRIPLLSKVQRAPILCI